MFCKNCGYAIPDDCCFCPKCGKENETAKTEGITSSSTKIDGEVVVTNTDINERSPLAVSLAQPSAAKKSFIKTKTAKIVIAAVLVIAIVIFVWQMIGINELKMQLMRDWERVESNDGSYYQLVLDFSDNNIDYNFESGLSWLNTTIATYDYEVIAPNMIKATYGDYSHVITIEFNEDKSMMIMTPAITSTDSSENWFNID